MKTSESFCSRRPLFRHPEAREKSCSGETSDLPKKSCKMCERQRSNLLLVFLPFLLGCSILLRSRILLGSCILLGGRILLGSCILLGGRVLLGGRILLRILSGVFALQIARLCAFLKFGQLPSASVGILTCPRIFLNSGWFTPQQDVTPRKLSIEAGCRVSLPEMSTQLEPAH